MTKRIIALLIIVASLSILLMAATSSFYISDDAGNKIPIGTGGELRFDNISGIPNSIRVLNAGGTGEPIDTAPYDSHLADSTIHFTLSAILHDALTGAAGYANHSSLDATNSAQDAAISTLDSHAADNSIHYVQNTIDHANLIGATGYANHSSIDATNSAQDAAINSHSADSTIHFTQASITHDTLSGAAGYANHSTIDAHLADTSIHAAMSIPPGTIWMFAGLTAPDGWMLADGSCVSETTYSGLYASIGNLYEDSGSPCAAGNFRLPDFRGRAAIGAGQGSGLTMRSLGDAIGAETHVLTQAEMPSHGYHLYGASTGPLTGAGGYELVNTGGDAAHNTMQPSLTVNYIIKQ